MWSRLKGWKTMIWSGGLALTGIIITVLEAFNTDMIGTLLPDRYKPFAPLILTLIGVITGGLRMITTTPWGRKEDNP